MSKPSFSNLDGVIENFDAVTAGDNIGNKYFDQDNFYPACGCSNISGIGNYDAVNAGNNIGNNYFDQDNFYPADGYSNVRGIIQGTFLDKSERARRRSVKEERKRKDLENQKILAKNIGKSSQTDAELLASLNKPVSTKSAGMSTTTKVLIGVGIVGVIGVAAYFLLKRKNDRFGKTPKT